jgi:hypothetical protein
MDFYRSNADSPEVILIDGLWGTGKSLLAPLISSLQGSGPFRIDQNLDVMTAVLASEKVSDDAYRFVVLNRLIENHFNSIIGREINLRPSDDSSFFKVLPLSKIVERLRVKDVEGAWARSMTSGEALVQVTHLLGLNYLRALPLLPKKLKVINVQRNPILLVHHWEAFLNTFSKPRELTPSYMVGETKIPFFASDWADEWIRSSTLERALLSIARCYGREWESSDRELAGPMGTKRLKVVYFSRMLENPHKVLDETFAFTGRARTNRTSKLIKREFEERVLGLAGRKSLRRQDCESELLDRQLERLAERSSEIVFKEFIQCVEKYLEREKRFFAHS